MKQLIPILIIVALFGFLGKALYDNKSKEIPSALIGEPLPRFVLPNLMTPPMTFASKQLQGKVSLLNVWATWCYACNIEHKMLMKIKDNYHIPIYGIAYKDETNKAIHLLETRGNPYVVVGNDASGDVGIDLGIYGTPETFVINQHGKIIYRHIGAIDQEAWDSVLYPLIKKLERTG